MLYKKKLVFRNKFDINYASGKLPSGKKSIVLVRDYTKCKDCIFNGLAGLGCRRWSLVPKDKSYFGTTLYRFCMNIKKTENLEYRLKAIL